MLPGGRAPSTESPASTRPPPLPRGAHLWHVLGPVLKLVAPALRGAARGAAVQLALGHAHALAGQLPPGAAGGQRSGLQARDRDVDGGAKEEEQVEALANRLPGVPPLAAQGRLAAAGLLLLLPGV